MIKPAVALTSLSALSLGLLALGPAHAQTLPRSFVASPEIYKVLAQNDQYKVIAVTWKPGQKDALHAHPANAVYYLTDCSLRIYAPDGSPRDAQPKADCRLVMFEPS